VIQRGFSVGLAGVVLAATALAGCSNNKSNTGTSGANAPSPGAESVIVGGQKQNVSGQASCVTSGDNVNIGIGDPTTGIGAVVSTANPPTVHSVGLGNVNGVTLGYSDTAPGQGNAQASKNGNSYKITGTATGVNMANPQQPVTKSFEIDVTCP
jgi:lipoprotein LpqH